MSHIVQVSNIKILHLDLLEEACQELGYELKEGGQVVYWAGEQKADYTISIPGTPWTIGLRKEKETDDGYILVGDFFGMEGKRIKEAAQKLTVAYQRKVAEVKLMEMGYTFETQELENGSIQIVGVKANV